MADKFGVGHASHGSSVAAVIEQHLAPLLVGQDALNTDRLADMMFRLTKPYGTVRTSPPLFHCSAGPRLLWDLKGKILAASRCTI